MIAMICEDYICRKSSDNINKSRWCLLYLLLILSLQARTPIRAPVQLLASQVPQLYCIQLGVQYPKNSKIWLWLLPQPTLGNALVEVDKNWNISGLVSGFQLEKLVFIHTVRSYSHSTATAEFVTSIGLKKWDGFLTFSTVFVKITQEKSQILPRTNLKVLKCEKYSWSEASDDITNPAVAFTNSAVAVEWL